MKTFASLAKVFPSLALLLGLGAITLHAAAQGQPRAATPALAVAVGTERGLPAVDFWGNRRDGWFWYRTPPPPQPEPKTAGAEPALKTPRKDDKGKDIEEFEDFQARLENLRKIAIIKPTPENVRAYMVYERMAFKQSTLFAEMQQALNWVDPVFAEDLAELRPVNAVAMRVWDQQRGDSKREFLSRLSKTHGLYFFIRGDCPYCHAFAPLIKRFSEQTGITVFPVTLDGGGNRDYPKPTYDNGIAARLGIKMVPALVLAQPSLRDYQVVSFGVVSEEEIMDRIYSLMTEKRMANSRQP